jgi:hypothetical protein
MKYMDGYCIKESVLIGCLLKIPAEKHSPSNAGSSAFSMPEPAGRFFAGRCLSAAEGLLQPSLLRREADAPPLRECAPPCRAYLVLRGARLFLFPIFTCDVKNGKNIEADDGDPFPNLSQIGKCHFAPLFPGFLPPPGVSPAPLGLPRAGRNGCRPAPRWTRDLLMIFFVN